MQPLALIRTYVPVAVGALISWLATLGIQVDSTVKSGLVVGLTAVVTAVYYTAAHWLESRWPVFSFLLGANATPSYDSKTGSPAAPESPSR